MKTIIKEFFIGLASLIFFTSCIKDSSLINQNLSNSLSNSQFTKTGKKTILGKKIPNYYSPEIINKVLLKLINSSQNKNNINRNVISGCEVSPNFKYVKFLPENADQFQELQELGYDLYEEPLDFEIEEQGDFYQEQNLNDSIFTPMYTILPIDTELPGNIRNEIISYEFLFNTEFEEREPSEHEDGYLEDSSPYYCAEETTPTDVISNCEYSRRCDIMNEAYNQLINCGINPAELEDEAMREVGYQEDQRCSKRYPQGKLTVTDNELKINLPVKGVMVKARNFLKIKRVYTNVNGEFKVTKKYRRASIIVKFKNGFATTRGIDNWVKIWDIFFPIKKNIGRFSCDALTSINYNFDYNSNERTQGAERWSACHTMNSLWETYEETRDNNINNPPNKLRIYLVSRWRNSNAFTSMFSQTYGRSFPINTFLYIIELNIERALTSALFSLMKKNAPDIFIPIFSERGERRTSDASTLINTCYHELGHAVHYKQVTKDYWKDFTYVAYGYNLLTYGGDYGTRNGRFAPFVAVTEMWGYYFGNLLTAQKYNLLFNASSDPLAQAISRKNLRELENNIPDNLENVEFDIINGVSISRGWIPLGYSYDMTDQGENLAITGVDDLVDQYNLERVFSGMQYKVTSPCEYLNEVLIRNNNLQNTQMSAMLDSYQWYCK